LLEGPPGCGKTSVAKAICSKYQASFYTVNFRKVDEIGGLPAVSRKISESNSEINVILLEDVSALQNLKQKDEKESATGCTLSEVLNFLDGVDAPEGTIFIMTANFIEELDPALKRRIDEWIVFENATKDQIRKMCLSFLDGFPYAEDVSNKVSEIIPNKTIAMSELQNQLMLLCQSPDDLIEWAKTKIQSNEGELNADLV
jgi:chaperone BCS1